jgi:hypothetical protein
VKKKNEIASVISGEVLARFIMAEPTLGYTSIEWFKKQ